MVQISERMREITRLVTPGNRVVDVGCDHGFVSIYLVQQQISPKVLAMDVRTGPLSAAKEHIVDCGLESLIETRLSDGLIEYTIGEADTMICAGMGGKLMARILQENLDKTRSFQELILQPQSELTLFRRSLRNMQLSTAEERMVYEDGKYYFLMKVYPEICGNEQGHKVPCAELSEELCDKYGGYLIANGEPLLADYLEGQKHKLLQVAMTLRGEEKERTRIRLAQIEKELQEIDMVLELIQKTK